MKISIICAISKNRVIGKDNQLIWHIPEDLKHFKNLTQNNAILMGRKTFESIGRLLPNRLNIILTRDKSFKCLGAVVIHEIDDVFNLSELQNNDKELFIIGGAEIYKQWIHRKELTRMYLTEIHETFDGDAFFPNFNLSEWTTASRESKEYENLRYDFVCYEKR